MAAVVIRAEHLDQGQVLLDSLRTDLRRLPEHQIHWKNIKGHGDRMHAASSLAGLETITVSSVVVCKRYLPPGRLAADEDSAYLYTLRYLLERLSWIARDDGRMLTYTLAHIVRFRLEQLRDYENRLRKKPDCNIHWDSMSPGRLDDPKRIPLLQLADVAASAIAQAFEPDSHGRTEPRYLKMLSPVLYRRGEGANRLTSYGLKMHPWNDETRAAYPWVAAL
jgi:hypothetical protein